MARIAHPIVDSGTRRYRQRVAELRQPPTRRSLFARDNAPLEAVLDCRLRHNQCYARVTVTIPGLADDNQQHGHRLEGVEL